MRGGWLGPGGGERAACPTGQCPPAAGTKAPGSRPPRREASRGCAVNAKSQASAQRRAADGVLGRSPMKREQIIYSLIPVRVPGAGEWRGLVALQLGPRRLLLLLSAQSPIYGLRGLATHTLHALTPLL